MLGKRELYCITGIVLNGSTERIVEQACAGGAQVIQFRHKGAITEDVRIMAKKLRNICKKNDVIFIINDFPELVMDVDADGLHLGQDDLQIDQARRMIGPGKLIGVSTHSYEQAMQARLRGADYLGFGPVFATPTKPDYAPVGLDRIDAVVRKVDIPVFVIGGIDQDNTEAVIEAGAERVAVMRAVCGMDDVAAAARRMRMAISQAKKEKIFREL